MRILEPGSEVVLAGCCLTATCRGLGTTLGSKGAGRAGLPLLHTPLWSLQMAFAPKSPGWLLTLSAPASLPLASEALPGGQGEPLGALGEDLRRPPQKEMPCWPKALSAAQGSGWPVR